MLSGSPYRRNLILERDRGFEPPLLELISSVLKSRIFTVTPIPHKWEGKQNRTAIPSMANWCTNHCAIPSWSWYSDLHRLFTALFWYCPTCALSDYHVKINSPCTTAVTSEGIMEQVTGIEPAKPSVWKTDMQPFTPHLLIPISLGLRPTFTDGILVCIIPVLIQHIQVHTGPQPFCSVITTSLWLPAHWGVEPRCLHIRKHAQEDPTTVQD